MKHCFLAITILISVAFISVIGQTTQAPTKRMVQGTVEVENDCPVALSEAGMEVLENQPPPHRSVILQHQVKITNSSDREIKRMGLAYTQEDNNGGTITSLVAEDAIKGHQERLAIRKITIKRLDPKVSETLKVSVTGISFRDGTRWVPPRSNDYLLLSQSLFLRDAPLRVMGCNEIETNHRLKLRVDAEGIAAYRLGVLKDTPQEFAVKLGEWVNLDASNAVKAKEIEITARNNQTGLKPEDIYRLGYFTRYSRTGQAITTAHGVAMFVAEVKFADGTIWKQDLRREYLIWSE